MQKTNYSERMQSNIFPKMIENYSESRKDACGMNLAGMILSLSNNNSNEWEKPEELFDIFIEAKDNKRTPAYVQSLKNSKECMVDQSKLRKNILALREGDPSSALVVPLLGTGHLWSTVIKKTSEGYNAYIINKGLRFWHDPVEEFVFNNKIVNGSSGLDRLLGSLRSARKPRIMGALPPPKSINTVYETFIHYADKKYNINQTLEDQKVGNCFTINLYAGIKFYQATLNTSFENWKENRLDTPYTPNGTKPDGKQKFVWENSNTENMKRAIIQEIAAKHPRIAPQVLTLLDIYFANRQLRKDIKEGKDLYQSMEKNFNPMNKNQEIPFNKRLELYVSLLSPHNFKKYNKELHNLIKQHGTKELDTKFQNVNDYFDLTDMYTKTLYMTFFYSTNVDPVKSLLRLFDKDGKKTKDMSLNQKMDYCFDKIHPMAFRKFKGQLLYCMAKANQDKSREYIFEKFNRLQANSISKFRELDGRLEKLIKDLPELKRTMPLVAKDLAGSAGTFVQLAGMISGLSLEEGIRDVLDLTVDGNLRKLMEKATDITQLRENIKFILDYVGKQQDDREKGARYLDISLGLEESRAVHIMKAISFFQRGDKKEAVVEIGRAIMSDPDDAALYVFRSEMYHLMGNHENAKKDLETAKNKLALNERKQEGPFLHM